MAQVTDRHVWMRCTNGHERRIDFRDYLDPGNRVRHVACVAAAFGEVFPSYDGIWCDDGNLPKCPCGAHFVVPPSEQVGSSPLAADNAAGPKR